MNEFLSVVEPDPAEFERAEDKRWRNAGTPKADSRKPDTSMASRRFLPGQMSHPGEAGTAGNRT
jgi:hypothetical protein